MADKNEKRSLTKVKQACKKYKMIEDKDRIAIGLSGGKDSSALLFIMHTIRRHLEEDFDIIPIYVDLGFGMDPAPIRDFARSFGYDLLVEKTDIREIVFDIRREKSPCALCAKMRKGALIDRAGRLGANKLALGHHLDDALETFFMNLLYTGKLASFPPTIYLDRKEVTLIRPMIYLTERVLSSLVEREGLLVVDNACPLDKKTKREEMKGLIAGLEKQYPDLKRKFLSAMENVDQAGIWDLWLKDPERK